MLSQIALSNPLSLQLLINWSHQLVQALTYGLTFELFSFLQTFYFLVLLLTEWHFLHRNNFERFPIASPSSLTSFATKVYLHTSCLGSNQEKK